jgi:hypothetical protein
MSAIVYIIYTYLDTANMTNCLTGGFGRGGENGESLGKVWSRFGEKAKAH